MAEDYLTIEPADASGIVYSIIRKGTAGNIPKELKGTWTKNKALEAIKIYNEKGK